MEVVKFGIILTTKIALSAAIIKGLNSKIFKR